MAAEQSSSRGQVARDVVMSILAMASVGIGVTLLSEEDISRVRWLEAIDFVIVAIFWLDFIREIRRTDDVRAYLASHWWELPSLIPRLSALVAMFPGFALLRVVRVLRIFRVLGVILRLRPAGAYVARLAREARLGAIFGIGGFVVFLGTLLAHATEARVNPNLESWGQATWFSLNMMTNVAYLDFQPATTGGKVLAGILQVCGIAFIGIFTASLAGAIIRDEPARK